MSKLNPHTEIVDSSLFTYDANTKTFVSEYSMFDNMCLRMKLYTDACDEGFRIRSAKTGNIESFALKHTEKTRSGQVVYAVYVPTNYNLLKQGVTVKIFND